MNEVTRPKIIQVEESLAVEVREFAERNGMNPEDVLNRAVAQYLYPDGLSVPAAPDTPEVREMSAMEAELLRPERFGSAEDDGDARRRLRAEAKRRLACEGLGPVKLVLDGVAITDGVEYQERIRSEW